MKRFQIKITLSNGDKINAKSVGKNREDAVNRLFSVPDFVSFVGSNEIKTAEAVEIPFEKINPENFLLQKSESKENHFVVTDLKRNLVIIFERGFSTIGKNAQCFLITFQNWTRRLRSGKLENSFGCIIVN